MSPSWLLLHGTKELLRRFISTNNNKIALHFINNQNYLSFACSFRVKTKRGQSCTKVRCVLNKEGDFSRTRNRGGSMLPKPCNWTKDPKVASPLSLQDGRWPCCKLGERNGCAVDGVTSMEDGCMRLTDGFFVILTITKFGSALYVLPLSNRQCGVTTKCRSRVRWIQAHAGGILENSFRVNNSEWVINVYIMYY